LCVAVVGEDRWRSFVDALGLGHLASDARFVDADARAAHDRELWEVLEPVFLERSAGDWFVALDGRGVACEVADPTFALGVFDDPEMRALGLVVEQQHPKLGRFEHFGTTIDFSDTPGRIWGPPPIVGQHTREIMGEHGYANDEIEKLLAGSAVFEDLWVD
jgi:crotonobetainyl-CoA:carnitine CoA-transferase CaiB-like acyl-CoA transferase